ncbi:MAG: sodium:solute symporter [Acidobacteria bacterium]|nr:sodium:solute symporter [Acidobacteriota bacterium]MBV9146915.1 sodium:solute symporter [Acidobacteriota bacterium]MBV9437174.1 sodium:solute symporter [Acidobacteriota bacterium]
MGLNTFDLALLALYLLGITLFGIHFRSADRSLKSYFLADRNIPWWAISLSIVSAETSTLTVISIPGLAYDRDFGFLQLVLGYLVARVVICLIFVPQYFRGEFYTAYQLIDRRFGRRLHRFTAGLFLATRAAAEGVRVWAISIVVAIALTNLFARFSIAPETRDILSVAIITLLTLVYTFEGGMSAVVWTDVVQMTIYIAGTIVGFFTILHLVPGGWGTVHGVAGGVGKFRVFDFSFSPSNSYSFWAGVIGGTFLTTSTHGTDQLMVQRLLAARSERQAKLALLSSGVFILIQFWLFLLVGASLYVFYKLFPPLVAFSSSDRIFPTFIVNRMPHGISGLLVAAILAAAMSNLSAALNSLSSTTVVDFVLRRRPQITEQRRVAISRFATVLWGIVLFGLALLSRHGGRVVEIGLTIISVAYGSLLGVFLLGILTRRATEWGAIVGMGCGLAINLYLWLGAAQFARWAGFSVAYTWLVAIGTVVTFAVGYGISLFISPPAERLNA